MSEAPLLFSMLSPTEQHIFLLVNPYHHEYLLTADFSHSTRLLQLSQSNQSEEELLSELQHIMDVVEEAATRFRQA